MSALDERALLSVALGRDVRLADLTSRRALQFGITASLGADPDYSSGQAFAVEALRAGFGGIRYFVRHDPAQKLFGIALFGDAGVTAEPAGATDGQRPDPGGTRRSCPDAVRVPDRAEAVEADERNTFGGRQPVESQLQPLRHPTDQAASQ